jgi:hypothetical protein
MFDLRKVGKVTNLKGILSLRGFGRAITDWRDLTFSLAYMGK